MNVYFNLRQNASIQTILVTSLYDKHSLDGPMGSNTFYPPDGLCRTIDEIKSQLNPSKMFLNFLPKKREESHAITSTVRNR